jgi:hypothetical protein
VNNESSEIIRMFYTEFDALIPEHLRESSKGAKGILPEHLRKDIDTMNAWVYDDLNNGVYKTGFAQTQEAYEQHVYPVFKALDRLEEHLGQPGHGPYLFGDHITEADIRVYPTVLRFDVAYYTIFKCNLKMIRYEYPRLHDWMRRLYWDETETTNGGAFKSTVDFQAVCRRSSGCLNGFADFEIVQRWVYERHKRDGCARGAGTEHPAFIEPWRQDMPDTYGVKVRRNVLWKWFDGNRIVKKVRRKRKRIQMLPIDKVRRFTYSILVSFSLHGCTFVPSPSSLLHQSPSQSSYLHHAVPEIIHIQERCSHLDFVGTRRIAQ